MARTTLFQEALSGTTPGPVLPLDLERDAMPLDLSGANEALAGIDAADIEAFNRFITDTLIEGDAKAGMGGYLEDRHLYRKSPLFNDGKGEPRSLHLGVDLWTKAGTPVLAPLDGTVHSFQYNGAMLDYGATIILEHDIGGLRFWTLYGHLSRDSLEHLEEGQRVERGQVIARLGENGENGGWAPHLHFQLITDLLGKRGDYPGVCRPSEREAWAARCPDPGLLLGRQDTSFK